eukprot:TRINITY_DN3682_c0_g1_i1.p1 TRINITY_DN3682_c0_g1~~TRINITY_DN3682_c0_g1_i1.p1  ORF type:complete len:657 (+),score=77.50 TRINITY_DN3682_c0_g1_i1:78-2048(+)
MACGTACVAVILIITVLLLVIAVLALRWKKAQDQETQEEWSDKEARLLLEGDPTMPDPELGETTISMEDVEIGRNGERLKLNASHIDEGWESGVVIHPEPGGIASRHHIAPGILLEINETPINSVHDVKETLKNLSASQASHITLKTRPCAVVSKEGTVIYHVRKHNVKTPLGLDLENIGFAVFIKSVTKGSPAQLHGVRPGKLLSVNKKEVFDKETALKVLKAGQNSGSTLVTLTMDDPDASSEGEPEPQITTEIINPRDVPGLGFVAVTRGSGAYIATNPQKGSGFEKAGVLKDARILSIGGQPIEKAEDISKALQRVKVYEQGFPLTFANPVNPMKEPIPPPPQLQSYIYNTCNSENASFAHPPRPTDDQDPEEYSVGPPRLAPVVKGKIEFDGTHHPPMLASASESGSVRYGQASFNNLRNQSAVTFDDKTHDEDDEEDGRSGAPGSPKLAEWQPVVGMHVKTRPKSKVGRYSEAQKPKAGCKAIVRKVIMQRREDGDQTYVYLGFKKGTMTWRWEDCSCVQHRLEYTNLLRPTGCDKCEKLMWAILNRDAAYICVDCRNRYHKACGRSLVNKGGAAIYDPEKDAPGPSIDSEEPVLSEEEQARTDVMQCDNDLRHEAVALAGGRDLWRDKLSWKERLSFIKKVEIQRSGSV